MRVENLSGGLGDEAHIAAAAPAQTFNNILKLRSPKGLAAAQIRNIAQLVVPCVQQDVAGAAVHNEDEGVSVVGVCLIAAGCIL